MLIRCGGYCALSHGIRTATVMCEITFCVFSFVAFHENILFFIRVLCWFIVVWLLKNKREFVVSQIGWNSQVARRFLKENQKSFHHKLKEGVAVNFNLVIFRNIPLFPLQKSQAFSTCILRMHIIIWYLINIIHVIMETRCNLRAFNKAYLTTKLTYLRENISSCGRK